MIRRYWPQLFELAGDHAAAARAERVAARTSELTEFLAARPPAGTAEGGPTVAYHHGCHLLRELHVHDAPLQLLEAAGCHIAEWEAGERCCGFGGTFSVKLPETAVAMADDKLDALPEGVTEIVSTDSSCLLQLRSRAEARGLPVRTRHVAQVLADRRPR
jgi:L-lactate dehydrogenase complex protein LldE